MIKVLLESTLKLLTFARMKLPFDSKKLKNIRKNISDEDFYMNNNEDYDVQINN